VAYLLSVIYLTRNITKHHVLGQGLVETMSQDAYLVETMSQDAYSGTAVTYNLLVSQDEG